MGTPKLVRLLVTLVLVTSLSPGFASDDTAQNLAEIGRATDNSKAMPDPTIPKYFITERRVSDQGYRLRIISSGHETGLGTISRKVLKGKGKNADKLLADLLAQLSGVIGPTDGYEIRSGEQLSHFPSGDSTFTFHQIVNGLPIPRSLLYLKGDQVDGILLTLVKTSHPRFDRSAWLDEQALQQYLEEAVEARSGSYNPIRLHEPPRMHIVPTDGSNPAFLPVLDAYYGSQIYRINVLTGELTRSAHARIY